ncbi:MAG: DUF934 domain-containing protein [Gammaproteobacteria bacterium]|nr:DUF934 domain-containing protein [Gammaproteobacteria bacterium]
MHKISVRGIEESQALPRVLQAPFEDLQSQLGEPSLAIEFATFADGRGFSVAKRLRQLGYAGELLATGYLIPDQWQLLIECGFDAVVLDDGRLSAQGEAHWQAAISARDLAYQYDTATLNSVWQQRFAVQRQVVHGH